jgi:AcrR family transcriptional regulator
MAATNSEQLRRTIARAAIPLLGEYDALTMAQIARAAGIGEGDLLAVFPDKEAVIQASIAMITEQLGAAIDPTAEVRELDAIRVDQPLASRLVEALDIVDAYYRRVRADFDAVQQDLFTGTDTADSPGHRSFSRQDLTYLSALPEARQAVARLLEPDRRHLRLPAETLAEAFLDMVSVGARTPNEDRSPPTAEQVVDLFLNGAVITS